MKKTQFILSRKSRNTHKIRTKKIIYGDFDSPVPPLIPIYIIEDRILGRLYYPNLFNRVIYIIADQTDPPLFTTLSLTAAYNLISGGNTDSIVIQAALGGEYFNKDATHFLFSIGDNKQTLRWKYIHQLPTICWNEL